MSWTWEHEGRRKTVENPLLLANRKCKRLKSLLGRQRAIKKEAQPFIDPIVFLSHPDVKCFLSGVAANNVRLRDQDASKGEGTERAGIIGAIRRRECPGLRQFQFSRVNRHNSSNGTRNGSGGNPASQNARRVGDFLLDRLVFDSPTGSYQDWVAKHAAMESPARLERIYMVARQTTEEQRKIIKKAAFREFQLLERLDHPGILKTEPPTECEYGPVLFFRRDPDAVPLDHFLRDEGDSLAVDQRLDILRQSRGNHPLCPWKEDRSQEPSPQSILLKRDRDSRLVFRSIIGRAGANLPGGTNSGTTQISATLHASQLIEDSSLFISHSKRSLAARMGEPKWTSSRSEAWHTSPAALPPTPSPNSRKSSAAISAMG